MKTFKSNIITLLPLNPNISLTTNDSLSKAFSPSNDTLSRIVNSEEIQMLPVTNAATKTGQDYIIKYYGIENWKQLKNKAMKMGLNTNMASTYFFLLKAVKYMSKKDNVWMSFYEGLY